MEQEQAYAAAALAEARLRAEQARERRAIESENVHTYARNADVAESGLRFAARRTMSVKNGSSTGFQPLDEGMRPRASSLCEHSDNTGHYTTP